jgi:addiction module HigA family antidote
VVIHPSVRFVWVAAALPSSAASARKPLSWPRWTSPPCGSTGETQRAFAVRIGWTRARLNEFIRGKRGVTADAALDLADVLGTSSKVWMHLQATWDLDVAVKRRRSAA